MAESYKSLAQGQLSASAATLYSPSGVVGLIRHIHFINLDTSDRTFTLRQGGDADTNSLYVATTIPAGGTADITDVIILDASETLRGHADTASKITYTIYGVEIS